MGIGMPHSVLSQDHCDLGLRAAGDSRVRGKGSLIQALNFSRADGKQLCCRFRPVWRSSGRYEPEQISRFRPLHAYTALSETGTGRALPHTQQASPTAPGSYQFGRQARGDGFDDPVQLGPAVGGELGVHERHLGQVVALRPHRHLHLERAQPRRAEAGRRHLTRPLALRASPPVAADNITYGKMVTWFVTSLPTDNRPQPKEALLTVSQL